MSMHSISPAESTLLGTVQGLTEFLPVSSSGHLVIFQNLLGFREPQILFDVVVHFGTLLAVVLVYRQDLWRIVVEAFAGLREMARTRSFRRGWEAHPYFRLAVNIVLATLPAAVAGILFEHELERIFGSLSSAGGMLLVTGTVLFFTRKSKDKGIGLEQLSLLDGITIGFAQAFALFPGISRSGMTIATGLFRGLNRDLAARFSFLLSVPAILGATILEISEIHAKLGSMNLLPFLLGGGTALVTGYIALRILLRLVHQGRLFHFAFYCWALGSAVLLFSLLSPQY